MKILIWILIGTIVGIGGVLLFLANFNAKIVYYKSGQKISIRMDSVPSEPYPLLSDVTVKNVILFISDGVGPAQLSATRIHYLGPDGRLNIERMPVSGLVVPHAIDNIITDSASSATSLAIGVKTKKRMLGVDANGVARMTILEAARDAGMSTGLVTTTQITDATPAAFASHVAHRYDDEAFIPMQLIDAKVNVLIGQGAYFYPKSDPRSDREDGINPLALAKEAGYEFVDSKEKLADAQGKYILALFEDLIPKGLASNYPVSGVPALAELTSQAIEKLSKNEAGFFLLIEDEASDNAAHVNREDYLIHYLKKFDDAVKVGIDFALQNRQTLILVMSDHETGGFNIVKGAFEDGELEFIWNTGDHTGQYTPLFAFGPHAMRFTGVKDNTELPKIMAKLLGLDAFLDNFSSETSNTQ